MTDRYTLHRDYYNTHYTIERDGAIILYLWLSTERNAENAEQVVADLNAYDAAWDALPIGIQKACEPDHAGDVAHGIGLLIARTAEALPRWRKMDSAPKDGSYVLVHFPDGDQMTRLRWITAGKQWCDKRGNIWRITGAARWMPLPGEEARSPAPCTWTEDADAGSYDTSCGNKHIFAKGTPAENGYRVCLYCGGALENASTAEAARKADAKARPRWRTMESAPKDGTPIVVIMGYKQSLHIMEWDNADNCWYYDGGSCWHDFAFDETCRWCPLPEDSE